MRTTAIGVVVLLATALLPSQPTTAHASTRAHPGDFTGYALDTCDAPSQRAMNAWRTHSKYWGVGVYIAGTNRACSTQEHLTPRWVKRQSRKGWRLLPIVVGRQASCSPKGRYVGKRIDNDPDRSYRKARRQGRADARTGIESARRLGIGRGSVLWFDLEHFDLGKTHCRRSALAFVAGWTNQLHDRGWRSGLYSSASSGIRAVERARVEAPHVYQLPDYLWIAEWDGRDSVRSNYIGEGGWWPHRRVRQYRGDHHERHGGVRLHIDSNFLDVGRGTVGGRPAPHCKVRIGFRSYNRLERGDHGKRVRAAQCLLRQQGHYDGRLHGRYTKAMGKAVHRLQRRHDHLRSTGVLNRRTWTVLHATGPTRLLKYGAGGPVVRRLQRALNAADRPRLRVDGEFARKELRAVKRYQRAHRLPVTGVITERTWRALKRGKI